MEFSGIRECVRLKETPRVFLGIGKLGVSRGVSTAGKAVMSGDFSVCNKSISGGSGPVIGIEADPGSDCEPSSRIMGSLITREASMRRSPDNFYRGVGWVASENFGCLWRNMAVGEILNGRL